MSHHPANADENATRTFYRVHRADAGLLPFSAENAYSSLIDIPRTDDGTKSECQECRSGRTWQPCPNCQDNYSAHPDCPTCNGEGGSGPCNHCAGSGWVDCLRGYSCFEHATQLLDYFLDPFHPQLADSDPVIIFEGWQVGTGFDFEPTAVPDRVVETLPWATFRSLHEGV